MRLISGIVLVAFVLLLLTVIASKRPPLEVHNETDLAISGVTVRIADRAVDLPGLQASQTLALPLKLSQDGPLHVEIRFADGGRLEAEGGHFVPGMAGGYELTIVSRDSLRLRQR